MLINVISGNNRKRKYGLFLEQLKPSKKDSILDVGYSNIDDTGLANYLETYYPYPHNITALGIESDDLFKKRYPLIKTVIYDGGVFPFADQSFDIGWSNAVIEHVGDEQRQLLFLSELHRTCRQLFFTTPNRYFPIEVHTRLPILHWLPKKIFDKLLSFTPKRWAAGEYMNLLSIRKTKKLLKKAGIDRYQIYKNRFLGFTMDFCVIVHHS